MAGIPLRVVLAMVATGFGVRERLNEILMSFLRTFYGGGDHTLLSGSDSASTWCAAGRKQSRGWPEQLPAPGIARGEWMSDLAFLAASVAFFVVAVWYVAGCQSLRKGGGDNA